MTWFPSSEDDVDKFYVYRRLHGEEFNTLINVMTRDSVKNGRLLVVDSPEPNSSKRYYYHIETMNETGVTSEPSYETSFLFKGETVLQSIKQTYIQIREEINHLHNQYMTMVK